MKASSFVRGPLFWILMAVALVLLGSALLGMRVGSIARWSTPAGDEKAAEILAILFQPESSGDYAM